MAENNVITPQLVIDMISHWLAVPPGGYHGSGYGSDIAALLHQPLSSGAGDALIAKMKEDIPLLSALPDGCVNLYLADRGIDSKTLIIEAFGEQIELAVKG
jgi:hypothetical protein